MIKNKGFVDKKCEDNLSGGFLYYAAGLIEEDYKQEGRISGKDYLVVYISPLGEVVREWRSSRDIRLLDIEYGKYMEIKYAIEEAER